MRGSTLLAGAFAQAALGAIEPKNFIFIVPDGMAPASQTIARTYKAMVDGSSRPGALELLTNFRALTTVLTRLSTVKAPTSTILTTVTDTSTVTEVTTTTTTSVISFYFKGDTPVPGGLDDRDARVPSYLRRYSRQQICNACAVVYPPSRGPAQTVKKVVTATICERQQPVIGISITPPGRFVELGNFETAPGAAPPASGEAASSW
ncbi:hypothetical protein HYQ44_008828 [Verticillium longisporum]|nr:hypothetical protein HYQ44_008828 [Verticillium longisporum]